MDNRRLHSLLHVLQVTSVQVARIFSLAVKCRRRFMAGTLALRLRFSIAGFTDA